MIENKEVSSGLIELHELKPISNKSRSITTVRKQIDQLAQDVYLTFKNQGNKDPQPVTKELLIALTKSGSPKAVDNPEKAVYTIGVKAEEHGSWVRLSFFVSDYSVKENLGLVNKVRMERVTAGRLDDAKLPKTYKVAWGSKAVIPTRRHVNYDLAGGFNTAVLKLLKKRESLGLN